MKLTTVGSRTVAPTLSVARRTLLGSAVVLPLLAGGFGLAFTGTAAAATPHHQKGQSRRMDMDQTLYVSTTGVGTNSDVNCANAAYSSVQDAVNHAATGNTVYVCPGTYNEQVSISTSRLTLTGAGSSSIIDPTSATPSSVADLDGGPTIYPIVEVTPGTTGVRISDLLVDGSGISPNRVCGDNPVGILYQAASGQILSDTVQNVAVQPTGYGCGGGIGIFVEAGPTGTARVGIYGNTISNYDKNGLTCQDAGTSCVVAHNTVTGIGPTDLIAQNGVQIGPGGVGAVFGNDISANDYTGGTNSTEPQADFASGVLLYGAMGRTSVGDNTLTDDQIGVEVVHSDASVTHNTITETAAGIPGSIGVFAVPCDYYCGGFSFSGGDQRDVILGNTISFPGTPVAGTYGIWAGDIAASSTGAVDVTVGADSISGAENNVVLGPTATGVVFIGHAPGDG